MAGTEGDDDVFGSRFLNLYDVRHLNRFPGKAAQIEK
jgi:hypothetical protein